ncbi:uncharacterized protein LOC655743 [Tribolium castaneum]|uniref:uncharacterized protein LOC655743 n=1 Tax=Tribolium castaneum TaxID=7070 RepID=UPI0030FF28DE
MDVTFTNVLEGARQYFQGLPTATSSTAGPTYPNQSDNLMRNDTEQQQNEMPPSTAAYWPQEPTRDRPPSRPSYHQGSYQEQQYHQFNRPQSREAPSNQYHQYQRTPVVTTQNYHQLQNVGQGYYQQQPQQQRTYYQMQAKSQQSTQQNPYYKHLYAQSTNQMQYGGAKVENKQEQVANQTTSQAYRTTHNLPPIASLSLISYHSSRSNRDVIRTSSTKTRTLPTNSMNQMPKSSTSNVQRYPEEYRTQYSNNQNRLPQNYQYGTTTTTTTQNYTQVIMTTSNYTAPVPPTQSSQQYYQQQTNKIPNQNINGRVVPVIKQKRESPLDLSVKTVRTPADSTLDDADQDRKYYNRTTSHSYPTYDVYANSFQRNMTSRAPQMPASAPKVEFHPNFNTQMNNYRRTPTTSASTNRYPVVNNPYVQAKLPRVDFPPAGHGHKTAALYPVATHDTQKKRPADTAPSIIPNKMSKLDTWRQSIDQQIEQRLSSYKQQQQAKKMVNGQERPKEVYGYQNQNRQYQYPNQYHNQTYVPSASAHQYPGYQYPTQQQVYNLPQNNPSVSQVVNKNPNLGGADKRVLSLLRNSLEIKGAKKLEQEQMNRSYDQLHKSRLDVQHPSTDVTAPLQPKPGFINRHNVSPFTPTNLPDNNNTMYKLHIPKAIDSVNFEPETDSQVLITNHVNPNGDLDGLAALVAARIRTKAELKQVSNNHHQRDTTGTPPKLNKEKQAMAPRRRLFSRNEDDGGTNVPPRDKTGLRSSSETSVFDFPDTDSEGEMPVLERQTLEDMRRDRRSSTKTTEQPRPLTPDDVFTQACDSFLQQLKNGSGKKRGRRKKIEADVLAKLETVVTKPTIKKEDDDDSDAPLINCKKPDKQLSVSLNDLTQLKAKKDVPIVPRPAKKPPFGDGSHFYPGWEEEVYRYKKSLRMPPSLIHVTRPPQYHRLSTSLPDLDPNSPITKIKSENLDSDTESNHSFNLFSRHNYDSEGSSSIKSCPNTAKESSSILDKLLERCGGRKKRKHKLKVAPKVELLATPARDRKTTLENFKNVFLASCKKRIKQRVTIKEVFGEDRPASAPPVTCVDNIKIKEEPDDKKEDCEFGDTRQVLKNKLLSRGRKESLLKSLVDKKIKSELLDEEEEEEELDSKSETPSIDGDEGGLGGKKRNKFRNIRRKFSSGFDYIRKKKKSVKRDQENEIKPKRRGQFAAKGSPGSVQDIQKEIKGWVLNKGIGETILHRAARLGYTDITAYCLEKMEYSPSPKDNAGYTPLHEASTKGHLDIAKMLLLYGANVSESARGGIRPLHEAVENGYVEIVRLLLSYGADPKLATYSGMTPLALASDDTTTKLLQSHINDVEGEPGAPWDFAGPASCFDPKESGFDVLEDVPAPDIVSEEDDLEFEVSDGVLPNLYTLRGESATDRWILLQDLSSLLKIKSRDALLRQICPSGSSATTHVNYKSVLRELKMSDFLEQAHCCQFLNIGEKINTRASKIALVKYTDKVRELLNVERVMISVR